jgi:cytoskeletal protein RodZ
MLQAIFGAWWFWLALTGVLAYLTYRNNKAVKNAHKRQQNSSEAQNQPKSADKPTVNQPTSSQPTSNSSTKDPLSEQISLRGIHKNTRKK